MDRKSLLKRLAHETGLSPSDCASVVRAYDGVQREQIQAWGTVPSDLTVPDFQRTMAGPKKGTKELRGDLDP